MNLSKDELIKARLSLKDILKSVGDKEVLSLLKCSPRSLRRYVSGERGIPAASYGLVTRAASLKRHGGVQALRDFIKTQSEVERPDLVSLEDNATHSTETPVTSEAIVAEASKIAHATPAVRVANKPSNLGKALLGFISDETPSFDINQQARASRLLKNVSATVISSEHDATPHEATLQKAVENAPVVSTPRDSRIESGADDDNKEQGKTSTPSAVEQTVSSAPVIPVDEQANIKAPVESGQTLESKITDNVDTTEALAIFDDCNDVAAPSPVETATPILETPKTLPTPPSDGNTSHDEMLAPQDETTPSSGNTSFQLSDFPCLVFKAAWESARTDYVMFTIHVALMAELNQGANTFDYLVMSGECHKTEFPFAHHQMASILDLSDLIDKTKVNAFVDRALAPLTTRTKEWIKAVPENIAKSDRMKEIILSIQTERMLAIDAIRAEMLNKTVDGTLSKDGRDFANGIADRIRNAIREDS